jgi:hypothetical protein
MNSGVASNFRPQAFATRTAAERVKYESWAPGPGIENSRLPVAARPPQPKAASPLRGPESPKAAKDAHGIAYVTAPCIWPHGARNAASNPFSATC